MIANKGFWIGLGLFLGMLLAPAPAGMEPAAWRMAAIVLLVAVWWISEALPLTVTAFVPFIAMPAFGILSAEDSAASYWSPILFLFLGGSFFALAIERSGLHRRLALWLMRAGGTSPGGLLFALMAASALLSMIVSNTATALVMMPLALALLRAGGVAEGAKTPLAGALVLGIAYAASIGGLGTLVGTPTNAIAAGMIERTTGIEIDFATWMMFGVPIVLLGIPVAWGILMLIFKVAHDPFDGAAARMGIAMAGGWTTLEKRLLPLVALVVVGWLTVPFIGDLWPGLPKGMIGDGSVAIFCALFLFLIPDGSGRPLLTWDEANRAPWDVILMLGGGLALGAGITASGLAGWLGQMLGPLGQVPPWLLAIALVTLVIVITEFASNVAAATAVMPVVGGVVAATGADPLLLALPAAFAASWGFMMPAGTGPNAIAWATRHVALPTMVRAGAWIDVAGLFVILLPIWGGVWLLR